MRTSFANLSIPGLTVNFGQAEAGRAALGARAGNIWVSTARYEVDGSVTAKLWDQFQTKNGVAFMTDGNSVVVDDRFKRVFGEVTSQINVTNKSRGWSAFMNSGVMFNQDFVTVTTKGGARFGFSTVSGRL